MSAGGRGPGANGVILRRTGEATYFVTSGTGHAPASSAKARRPPRGRLSSEVLFSVLRADTSSRSGSRRPVDFMTVRSRKCREQSLLVRALHTAPGSQQSLARRTFRGPLFARRVLSSVRRYRPGGARFLPEFQRRESICHPPRVAAPKSIPGASRHLRALSRAGYRPDPRVSTFGLVTAIRAVCH